MPIDREAAYEETRRSLETLVRGLSQEELATIVPACPDWDVKDVLGHIVSEGAIAANGTLPSDLDLLEAWRDEEHARKRDELNAREVAARRDRSVPELLEEWAGLAAILRPMLRGEQPFPYPSFPFAGSIVVMDAALHNQDIRNALGRPGERETNAVSLGLTAYRVGLDTRLRALGLPPLRLRYGDRDKLVGGDGEAAATLSADRYELYRALASRRTRDQIRAMDWEGDPEPYLGVMPTYGERAEPLVE